jgi:hypothetical protein
VRAKQENKLGMYLAVIVVCKRYQTAWPTVPVFEATFNRFNARVGNIKAVRQAQGTNVGLAEGKQLLRETMCTSAVAIAGAICSYANATANPELKAKVAYSFTDLFRCRDTESAKRCNDIIAAAALNTAALVAYGVTDDLLVDLEEKIAAYEESLPKPRDSQVMSKAATGELAAEFIAADTILTGELDGLVDIFRATQPKFYEEYQNGRIIIDNPGGSATGPTAPPTPPPVP